MQIINYKTILFLGMVLLIGNSTIYGNYIKNNSLEKQYIISSDKPTQVKLVVGNTSRITFNQPIKEIIGGLEALNIVLDESKKHLFVSPKSELKNVNLTILLDDNLQDLLISTKKDILPRNYSFINNESDNLPLNSGQKVIAINSDQNYLRVKRYLKNPYSYSINTSGLLEREMDKLYKKYIQVIWCSKLKLAPKESALIYIYYKKTQ